MSYWFPPNNVIGASRAGAIAKFFSRKGWDVTVVCADSGAVSKDYMVDLSDVKVHRVRETAISQFLNFKAGRKRWARVVSALARLGAFPDGYRTTVARMGRFADDLIAQGQVFDVVLSTALPFSQHEVAASVAGKLGAFLVLDNRDAWARNAYRRRWPLSDLWECRYEHRVLSSADLITTISAGLAEHYRDNYPDLSGRVTSIRNGTDSLPVADKRGRAEDPARLRIVYTGILYGGKRDIRPVLEAARKVGLRIRFDFYGSEHDQVDILRRRYPDLEIQDHGRVSRDEALIAQSNANALLVALGTDIAERSFLPGKFFEYVGSGHPIIVIADDDFEICRLVTEHKLGIGTRDPEVLATFLTKVACGRIAQRTSVPVALTRDHQLSLLENEILKRLS